MNNFDYGHFDSEKEADVFLTDKGYVEVSNEQEARKQLSYPLVELRDFINEMISAGTGISIARGENGEYIISNPLTPTGEVSQEYVDQQDGLTLQEAKAYTDTHSSIYIGDDTPEEEVVGTLFEDIEKTKAVYPRTKFNAVSDEDGNTLGSIASLNMQDISEVGNVNAIAGYDGDEDSATLKNVNGVSVYPSEAGIDTTDVLASGQTEYTTTQDCFCFYNDTSTSTYTLTIDNTISISVSNKDGGFIFLKKGQNIKSSGAHLEISLYGLKR